MSTQNSSDHDLLLKLNTKFDMLYEEFRRTSNGTGFPRCVERLERLEQLEADNQVLHKRINDIKSKFWWAFTVAATTILGLVVAAMKGLLTQ